MLIFSRFIKFLELFFDKKFIWLASQKLGPEICRLEPVGPGAGPGSSRAFSGRAGPAPTLRRNSNLVLYRVQIFRVRVKYESEGIKYESSTSRVVRIHS